MSSDLSYDCFFNNRLGNRGREKIFAYIINGKSRKKMRATGSPSGSFCGTRSILLLLLLLLYFTFREDSSRKAQLELLSRLLNLASTL